MASDVINALFTAKETISEALHSARQSTSNFDRQLDELNVTMAQAGIATEGAEHEFDSFANGIRELRTATNSLEGHTERLDRAFLELAGSGEITEQQIDEFTSAAKNAMLAADMTDESVDNLRNGLIALASSGKLSGEQLGRLQTKFTNVAASATGSTAGIDMLSRAMLTLHGVTERTEESTERMNDELTKTTANASSAAVSLGVLSSVAGISAFQFSSLSVNIGPFNIALRNFLTQVPAILTGMSTMIALAGALAGAFVTLALATTMLLTGGALAFFEEFSKKFEESAEAVEAFMGALKDLFIEAMRPLMTQVNLDLFIRTIENAAAVVNRFAQFTAQMRSEVMGFFGQLDGNVAGIFESMHDSFVMMEPIILAVFQFLLTELPKIMIRFSQLSRTISDEIAVILFSVGALISELMDFASVVLTVLAPTIAILLGSLQRLFHMINQFPDVLVAGAIAAGIITIALVKLISTFASLTTSILAANAAITAQAAAGSYLYGTLSILRAQTLAWIAGNQTLRGALLAVRSSILTNTSAWAANTAAKLFNFSTTSALTLAMGKQLGIISALTAGNITLVGALKLTAANMWTLIKSTLVASWSLGKALLSSIYGAASAMVTGFLPAVAGMIAGMVALIGAALSAAGTFLTTGSAAAAGSAGVWSFSAALNSALSPIWLIVGALALLIGLFVALGAAIAAFVFDINVFDWLAEKIDWIIGKIQNLISGLTSIPGMGDVPGMDVANVDDIQTEAGVNLNFEDKLEQNIDVQADPEEKEQMRRTVKDAMNEANSIARRQQGVGQ